MKLLIVFIFFVSVGVFGYQWDPEELECLDEQKLNKTIMEDLIDPTKKPCSEDDEVIKVFLECSWKKLGMLDVNNEINWERVEFLALRGVRQDLQKGKTETEQALALVTGGIAKRIIDICHGRNIHAETPGLMIVRIQNCIGGKIRTLKGVLEN